MCYDLFEIGYKPVYVVFVYADEVETFEMVKFYTAKLFCTVVHKSIRRTLLRISLQEKSPVTVTHKLPWKKEEIPDKFVLIRTG